MFHTEYYWRPLKHLAYFVFVKKIRSVIRGANFKCFEPEGRMHGDLNSAFGKRKLHALKWFVQSGISLLSCQARFISSSVTQVWPITFSLHSSWMDHVWVTEDGFIWARAFLSFFKGRHKSLCLNVGRRTKNIYKKNVRNQLLQIGQKPEML